MKKSKKQPKHQIEQYLMLSASGQMFIIEPFGFYYTFEGLPQLGYWVSLKKMIDFYQKAFGFEYLGQV